MSDFVTHRGMDCLVVPGVSKTKVNRLYGHARRYSLIFDKVAEPSPSRSYTLYFPVLKAGHDATRKVVEGLFKVVS